MTRRSAVLAACALAAGWTSLANGFAYDDVPVIVDDARLHTWRALLTAPSTAYWADEGHGLMWRPVATIGFALQWVLGGGHPLLFHVGSLLLLVGCVLLLHRVLLAVLPRDRALAAAACFAVLPVHTEVVANVIGQSELWLTLLCLAASLVWLEGDGTRARDRIALAGLGLLAIGAKEQGAMLPLLLLALEGARAAPPRSWRALRPLLLAAAFGVAAGLVCRTLVLGGSGAGDPVPALAGLPMLRRLWIMLALVPTIAGTLLLPFRLVADYNPHDVPYPTAADGDVVLGLLVLGLAVAVVASGDRRRQTLALAGFAALAFAPVANVLLPTGVVFAERHLFLPSAALVALPFARLPTLPRASLRSAGIMLLGAMLLLGIIRSSIRNADWRDTDTIVRAMVRDAPDNYRALVLLAGQVQAAGRPDSAERLLRRALVLFPGDAKVYDELGQLIRRREGCGPAMVLFQRALVLQPGRATARARLTACQLRGAR